MPPAHGGVPEQSMCRYGEERVHSAGERSMSAAEFEETRDVWNRVVDDWRMQEHPVVRRIAATVGPPDDVMVMPSRQSGHLLVTKRAETVLLFPEVQQLPSSFEIVCHLHAQAFLEVHFPLGVIRICRASDLYLPLHRHISCAQEFQFVVCLLPEENPMASVPGAEVPLRHPAFGPGWMPSFGPRPQHREDGGVHVVEGDVARPMAVIVGPAPDRGMELGYQVGRGGLFVRLPDFPDFPQECLHILPGWFREELPSILPYMVPQKITAVLNVRNAGFLRGEFEPAFAEELLHQRCDFLFQEFVGASCTDEIIRPSHQIPLGSVGSVGRQSGVRLHDPFESVKRQIGEHRGADAPLRHPRFRGGENMLVHESCLQPLLEYGALHRDMGY